MCYAVAMIESPAGIIAVLAGIASFFFWCEKKTKWKLWSYFPPLLPIYILPVVFSNTGVIPTSSTTYDFMSSTLLPMFLVLLLLGLDVKGAVRIMGRGVFVMLLGTAGVIIGAPIAFAIVSPWLGPDAWKGVGALAGSWIGGTGNMAAVAEGLETSGAEFGLAVVADNMVYLVWLPILLASKSIAPLFHRFTKVPSTRVKAMEDAANAYAEDEQAPEFHEILYLIFLAMAVTYGAATLAPLLPELPPVLSESTWRILIITTIGIGLSFTPARHIPGSHALAMALVYLFVAKMGAKADLSGLAGQAVPFLAGAYIWIFLHGFFILLGAKVLKVDVHTAAIASAANIGGAASAPIVAAHHNEALVPVAILMAMIGYAVGNYGAFLAALLCQMVM